MIQGSYAILTSVVETRECLSADAPRLLHFYGTNQIIYLYPPLLFLLVFLMSLWRRGSEQLDVPPWKQSAVRK